MIIERLGNFHSVLAAGVHFIFPFIDRPKKFWFRCVPVALDVKGRS
jgi:hypothetical protein